MTKPRKRLHALTLLYTRRSPSGECRIDDEARMIVWRSANSESFRELTQTPYNLVIWPSFVIRHLSFVINQRYFASR